MEILKVLNNIETYEMNVLYSESADKGKEKNNKFDLMTECKTIVKYKKPYYLYINAEGNITIVSEGKKREHKLNIYTTFDGNQQKARYSYESDEGIKTKSIILDLSINNPDQPFDGFNPKGFGFEEGKEYIGTIQSIMNLYDFVENKRTNDIAEFSGTLNLDKCINMLSRSMPPERARWFAQKINESQKQCLLRVDLKRNLVIGFTLLETLKDISAKRICKFENIKINQEIKSEQFTFQTLPNEEFVDITEEVVSSRKLAEKLR